MAQIMEFLLNLLLLRGKLLTTTAAETLHEAIKKCMQFKRKIATEYNTTQIIIPFENMLEFINYNSSQYTCDGENFVITTAEEYDIYEKLKSERKQFQELEQSILSSAPTEDSTFENLETTVKKSEEHIKAIPDWLRREPVSPKTKNPVSEDYIVDNLHAILKSQEYLFKNIIKLVKLLEKNEVLTESNQKLKKVKKKLIACTDILSNNLQTQKFSSIINNIIEEEITRCRFRHGESKTSAEINLKVPRPKGIEAALDSSHKNKKYQSVHKEKNTEQIMKAAKQHEKEQKDVAQEEAKPESLEVCVQNDKLKENKIEVKAKVNTQALKRSKSDPIIPVTKSEGQHKPNTNFPIVIKETRMDLENSKKLIQVNEEHFNKFEDELWHSLRTMKFMSLKDEYLNTCKCAFYNKRHFVAMEAAIAKKIKEEEEYENFKKIEDISNKMFQMMECKLMFASVQKELSESGLLSATEEVLSPSAVEKKNQVQKNLTKTKQVKKQKVTPTKDLIMKNNPFVKLLPQNTQEERTQTVSQTRLQKKDSQPQKSQTEVRPQLWPSKLKLIKSVKEVKTGDKAVNATKSSNILQDNDSSTVIGRNNIQKLAPKCSEGIAIPSENMNIHIIELKEEPKEKLRKIRNDQETNTIINSFKLTKSSYTDLYVKQSENIPKTLQKMKEDNKNLVNMKKSTEEIKSSMYTDLNEEHDENIPKTLQKKEGNENVANMRKSTEEIKSSISTDLNVEQSENIPKTPQKKKEDNKRKSIGEIKANVYNDLNVKQSENIPKTPQKMKVESQNVAKITTSIEEIKSSNPKEEKKLDSKIYSRDKSPVEIVRSNFDLTHSKVKSQKTVSTSNIQKLLFPRKKSEGDITRSNVKKQKLSRTSSQPSQGSTPRKQKLNFTQLLKKSKSLKNLKLKQNVNRTSSKQKLTASQNLPRAESLKDVMVKEITEKQHTSSLSLQKEGSPSNTQKAQFPRLPEKSASKGENIIKSTEEKLPESSPVLKEETTTKTEKSASKQDLLQSEISTIFKKKMSTETFPLINEQKTPETPNLSKSETLRNEDTKKNLQSRYSPELEERGTSTARKLELPQSLSNSGLSHDIHRKEKLSEESLMNDAGARSPQKEQLQSDIFKNEEKADQKVVHNLSDSKKASTTQKIILPQGEVLENLEKQIAKLSPRRQQGKKLIIPKLQMPSENIKEVITSLKSEQQAKCTTSRTKSIKKSSPRPQQQDQRQEQKPSTTKPVKQVKHQTILPQTVSDSVDAINKQKSRSVRKQSSHDILSLMPDTPEKMPPNWKGVIEKVSLTKIKNITHVPKKPNFNNAQSNPEKTTSRRVNSTGRTTKEKNMSDEKRAMSEIVEKHSQTIPRSFTKIKNSDDLIQKKRPAQKSPEVFSTIKKDMFANIKEDIALKVNQEKLKQAKKDKEILTTVQKVLSPKTAEGKIDKNEQKGKGKSPKSKINIEKTEKVLALPNESQTQKKEKQSVSLVQLKPETDKEKKEKAFKELETTIRTVKVFIEKTPKKSNRVLKTTTEKKNRKIDEPVKKSMSTKQLVSVLRRQSAGSKTILRQQSAGSKVKQENKYSTPSEQISNDIILNRHRPSKKVTKKTHAYSFPSEKTFLKKSTNIDQSKNKSASSHDEEKDKQALTTNRETTEHNKPNSQMRRTTKNAMKRQQAVATCPKMSKNNEEMKKSQKSLAALKETKIPTLVQKKEKVEKRGLLADDVSKTKTNFGCIAKTVSPRSAFSNPLLGRIVNKALCGKIHCTRRKSEDIEAVKTIKS